MIPGFGGHLLPEAFIESRLGGHVSAADADDLRRRLGRWSVLSAALGPASSLRAMVDIGSVPLLRVLGIEPAGAVVYRETCAVAPCRAGSVPLLLVATPWGAALGRFWRDAVVEAARQRVRWCLLFNGTHLRLVCADRVYSRRHVEFQVDAAADDERSAAAVLLLFSGRALGGKGGGPPPVEQLLIGAERHEAVICRSLRTGVLDASTHVLRALVQREASRPLGDVFEQSLTIVYRLLFLLFAEARALVPMWHPVYRGSYSIEALREAAMRRDTVGLWDAMRAVTRLAHGGCRAGTLRVTAFNGRLFSPAATPLAERRGLDDEAAAGAVVAVSTQPASDGGGRERISYRDLGVDQLGSVYETLLDYAPHVERTRSRGAPLVSLRPGSGVRKSTGTFYTPPSLVDYLVRETLSPLVRDRPPEQILTLAVVDPSMGSGAFLVGACRYLAGAYESALVEHGRCHPSDLGQSERASIRRLVAERCLFGVDVNPMAVQLARLSLWLTTLSGERPLTFLDHHLRVGDSIAGTWLSCLRTTPARRRRAADLPLFSEHAIGDALRDAVPVRFRLATEPNDTAAQVRAKERALAALQAPGSLLARWRRVADAWCAAWFASPPVPAAAFTDLSDAFLGSRPALPASTLGPLLDRVAAMASVRRLFHWELEFPEVFFDDTGARKPGAGFDAVIGNPPWDMVRADAGGDRASARAEAAALVRFSRDAGVYEARADGQANRYQLFVERALALVRPGGRLGLVLPSGVAADAGSGALRRLLVSRCRVERIVGFDNRLGTFPIHRSVRFVLLSGTAGEPTGSIACRFGEVDPRVLETAAGADGTPPPTWFPVRLTPALLEKISGDDLSIPDLRSPSDLSILERAAELFAPLGSRQGWNAHFGRELNATEDRGSLSASNTGVPVFEGKLIEPFRVSRDTARWFIEPDDADRLLGRRWRHARLAYRDVASATNRLTLIAALLPPRSASTHTLFCLKDPIPPDRQRVLCALLNSLVVNFLVRLRVGTHVTTTIVERLPVPTEDQLGPHAYHLLDAARRLERSHDRSAFATLNARVGRVYQLTDDEFMHVIESFPLFDAAERGAIVDTFRRT